jgi:hypothetical protein
VPITPKCCTYALHSRPSAEFTILKSGRWYGRRIGYSKLENLEPQFVK